MGVLRCFKTGCDNIMCDTYIPEVGYICNDCQQQFKQWVAYKKKEVNQHTIIDLLNKFMSKETITSNYDESFNIDNFFSEYSNQ